MVVVTFTLSDEVYPRVLFIPLSSFMPGFKEKPIFYAIFLGLIYL